MWGAQEAGLLVSGQRGVPGPTTREDIYPPRAARRKPAQEGRGALAGRKDWRRDTERRASELGPQAHPADLCSSGRSIRATFGAFWAPGDGLPGTWPLTRGLLLGSWTLQN